MEEEIHVRRENKRPSMKEKTRWEMEKEWGEEMREARAKRVQNIETLILALVLALDDVSNTGVTQE